ncbi:MAG: SPFH/Band 7/PHB domain protein [Verrucomicrobia bacterium]|nr:SPFH/Band 7/PHB domain protein [Verrucomicrobiota bacterium]MCH8513591.1 SPFH/Band 7/PHB domain protein [Kiritimatiellia bacterium]
MFVFSLIVGVFLIPAFLWFARVFGLYAIVHESEAQVFTVFGKVIGCLDEAGLHVPFIRFGLKAFWIPFFGKMYKVDTALRQHYLRGQMVNSEEGTPMGVGIWYEKRVNDPEAYLFVNSNPEGSLEANVASSAISVLSNLDMDKMLEDRHSLSRTVRESVSPLSEKWGYKLGSVYIRKVAFTDKQMVDNITDKVVKRLVQVTSAMKQDGDNRVGLIKSQTAKKVSQKMAEASAARPRIVGKTLNDIAKQDEEVLASVLEVMETEKLLASKAEIDLVPENIQVLVSMGDASKPSQAFPPPGYSAPVISSES